ncbi:hypothetical protein O3597_25875 [Verrucosispora sp. WMMA2044]|uniref:hypothetical protein n=1 Tax=Verrucosispora sp. WMMA2044 TaxID=3016419 RepID=UPI00248D2659|nr:hypothetical protein [Verrucosispora sp. WMMA2044]WBB48471.1 hypothetical protein O3597_25875 [Verrucosispora sp. WMMA2044]
MSGIELIAAALAAGALAGTTGVAGDAVRETYAALKGLLRARLTSRPGAQQALEVPEPDPDRWVAAIGDDLTAVGADQDEDVLDAARTLLDVTRPPGHQQVYIYDSKGVVVGDGNTNNFTFNG